MEEGRRRTLTPEQRERRRKIRRRNTIIALSVCIVILALLITGVVFAVKGIVRLFSGLGGKEAGKTAASVESLIYEADRIAAGYDYDAAIEKIKSYGENYQSDASLSATITKYEEQKAALVPYADVHNITHVFFHTLIADNNLAFDGDYRQDGYNQYMTTISEFQKMLQEMYNRGYVLIDIHDMATLQTDENGVTKMTAVPIMLPQGKIPFVMSQDDVCYYNYMTTDGFATRLVIGDDGMPTCEYVQSDGTAVRGDYDVVPILERFIAEHPDFSYKGARAILAVTGYDGVLGYRTSPTGDGYNEADIAKAKEVADRMKECGWVFASHSWGHQKYGDIDYDHMKQDADRWEAEAQPIVGDTDVIIYANGNDISGVAGYEDNQKFQYLKGLGFNYFCNVDSSKYFVQIGADYLRQGRRNLDGYRMFYNPGMLSDLFNVSDVWDSSRPTPVPAI